MSQTEVEKLVEKWRNWNDTTMTPLTCADELEAAIAADHEAAFVASNHAGGALIKAAVRCNEETEGRCECPVHKAYDRLPVLDSPAKGGPTDVG